eukprot:CAMPEP_0117675052 /NCGR_PEP_ID=MMETSP0804-20121206/15390_1 /TAXON_ID=1074897 /ORGANISM="Tetraselmis astigmatica, Strain CCMP880" /LENGTH=213 /DNA_ID=CAMNT_0005484011 /DNA_START=113 /DNA_END=751 /DNA_ORIENTATION=-
MASALPLPLASSSRTTSRALILSSRRCARCQSRGLKALARPVAQRRRFEAVRVAATGATQEEVELIKSSQLLVKELRVLGMPSGQVQQYLLNSQRKPFEGFDNARGAECVKDISKGLETCKDPVALEFVAQELRELWLWKRRKGDYFGGNGEEMYQVALSDIQDVAKKAQKDADSEKISSILLDDMDMSDEDKSMLGDAIRGVAVGGLQLGIW